MTAAEDHKPREPGRAPSGRPSGDDPPGQQRLPFARTVDDHGRDADDTGRSDSGHSRRPDSRTGESAIRYSLTARARRLVAPASLPDLEILPGGAKTAQQRGVDDSGPDRVGDSGGHTDTTDDAHVAAGQARSEEFDPFDTRPARARALARAGLSTVEVAGTLGVDEVLVSGWCDDVGGRSPRTGRASVDDRIEGGDLPASAAPTTAADPGSPPHRSIAVAGRLVARAGAAFDEHADDAPFIATLGYVAGLAEIGEHAVTVRTRDLDVAALVLRWLRRYAHPDPRRVRLVLDVPRGQARDLVSERWASRLGLADEHVTSTTRRTTSVADEEPGVEALVRVADTRVAGTVRVWIRRLLTQLHDADEPGPPTVGTPGDRPSGDADCA